MCRTRWAGQPCGRALNHTSGPVGPSGRIKLPRGSGHARALDRRRPPSGEGFGEWQARQRASMGQRVRRHACGGRAVATAHPTRSRNSLHSNRDGWSSMDGFRRLPPRDRSTLFWEVPLRRSPRVRQHHRLPAGRFLDGRVDWSRDLERPLCPGGWRWLLPQPAKLRPSPALCGGHPPPGGQAASPLGGRR
jgi:hypothetical protein